MAYLRNRPLEPVVLEDRSGEANGSFGVAAYPTEIVLTKTGRIAARLVGLQAPETLDMAIAQAIKEPGTRK